MVFAAGVVTGLLLAYIVGRVIEHMAFRSFWGG
jgi:hypothetical protein